MSRKRLRYSELANPPATPGADAPSSAPSSAEEAGSRAPENAEPLSVERDDDAPLIVAREDEATLIEPSSPLGEDVEDVVPHVDHIDMTGTEKELVVETADVAIGAAPAPARPRRNSTPVELARTLTAERLAARARDGVPADEGARAAAPAIDRAIEPHRTLREKARARSGAAELLMFLVGGERFAVELIRVDEVIDLPVIHHVPEMPPAMLGVVTDRGSLTPVYSPQQALGRPLAQRDALLIFRRGAHRVGILIDDVDDALSVDMAELREKPAGEEGDNVLLGVIRLANTLVGIVDADALITSCQSAHILEHA